MKRGIISSKMCRRKTWEPNKEKELDDNDARNVFYEYHRDTYIANILDYHDFEIKEINGNAI